MVAVALQHEGKRVGVAVADDGRVGERQVRRKPRSAGVAGVDEALVEGRRRRTAEDELIDAEEADAGEVVVGEHQHLVDAAVLAEVVCVDLLAFHRLVQAVDEGVVALVAFEEIGAAAAPDRVVSGVGLDEVGDRSTDDVVVQGNGLIGLYVDEIAMLVPVGEGPVREIEVHRCLVGRIEFPEDVDDILGVRRSA